MKKKLISLLLACILAFGMLTTVPADEISDLESENEYTEQQLLDLKDSIYDLETQKADLLGDIDEKEKELVLTLAAISTLTEQVDLKNQDLAQTTKDLKTAKEDESTQYEAMKKRIQYLYETGGDAGWAVILLEDLSITEFLNRAEYTQQMYDYDRRCLEEYASTVQQVSTLKEREEEEKTDLERMLTNQEEQQTYLEEQLAKLKAESEDYEKRLADATTTADAYVELINQQNSMIEELLAEQERQRAAQEEANRIAEEQAAAAEEAARAAAEAEAAAQAAADDAARAQAEAEAEAARQAAAEAEAQAQAAAAEAERARQEEEALAAAMQQQQAPEAQPAAGEAEVQQDAGAAEAAQDTPEEPQEVQAEEPAAVEQPQISIPAGYPNVDRAAAWIGVAEYSYGACSPGVFDCSGFVSYCVTGGYTRVGTAYSFMTGFPQVTDPIPGDIASNGGHCGIYIGNGMMIHCADYGIGVIVGPVADNMIFTRY